MRFSFGTILFGSSENNSQSITHHELFCSSSLSFPLLLSIRLPCFLFFASPFHDEKDEKDNESRLENTCGHADDDSEDDEQDRHIPEFTRKELTVCNRQSPKMEIGGQRGNQSRRYQRSWRKDILVVHELFNLIVKQNSITPSSWKKAVISVIYKKGDGANQENYRPICGLQQLFKLFSTMLCKRPSAVLDQHRSADQAEEHSEQRAAL